MSYTMAVVAGYVLTILLTLVIAMLGNYIHYSPDHIIKKAYRNNTCAKATLEQCDASDTGLYTGVYRYQYKGAVYEYVKHFFNEHPTSTVELVWKPATPGQPIEACDIVPARRKVITYSAISMVVAAVLALVVPQGLVLVGVMVYFAWLIIPSLVGAIACTVVGGFIALGLWGSYLDAVSYNSFAHDSYQEFASGLSVIDEMEPIEVCHLYEAYMDYNYSYQDWDSVRSMPFACQFGDSWWEGKERLEWPAKYYKYVDWDYRDKIEEAYKDANP